MLKQQTIRIFATLMLVAVSMSARGAIHISVNAPSTAAAGEVFQIEYKVTTRDVDNFEGPNFPSGIDVLYGPSRSEMSNYSIVNGKTSGSSSVTFTYTCSADKSGSYTIGPAKVTIGGKTYNTRSVTIRVSGSVKRSQSGGQQAHVSPPVAGRRITSKDLFVTVSANKTRLYEQEPVVLTYKIYTKSSQIQMNGKMPDLKGFLTQEVPLPKQKTLSVESYNGENYYTAKWCQYVMFPQQTGKLVIPSIKFDCVVAVEDPTIDPFDAFFNGNPNFAEVNKTIVAPSLTINVSKLPSPKPADFSGAVGHFKIKSAILTKQPRTNENMSVRVEINGAGNMKLITAPKLNLGPDFDVFPAKVNDKTSLSSVGMTGTIYYDYVVVPHQKGNYTLPEIDLCYFDNASDSYSHAKAAAIPFRVEQGAKVVSEDEELLRRDINDIHRGAYSTPSRFFRLDNVWYYVCYAALLLAFVFVVIVLRRSEKFKNNATLRLKRHAKRTATKHLRKAYKLMKAGKVEAFYDELAYALSDYASHRLSIPMSEFKSSEISRVLVEHGVEQSLADEFCDVMGQCEFARFAPGNPNENMDNFYKRSEKAIMEIEDSIKK